MNTGFSSIHAVFHVMQKKGLEPSLTRNWCLKPACLPFHHVCLEKKGKSKTDWPSGAREGTRTPKDKPHAPQTCASASSATLAYLLYSSPVFEVENRWCGLLGYSNIFPAIRQVVSLFLISFFMLHIYNSSAARAKAALRAIAQVICTRKVCLRHCAQSKGGVCI